MADARGHRKHRKVAPYSAEQDDDIDAEERDVLAVMAKYAPSSLCTD